MKVWSGDLDAGVDVVVVGSGAIGLTAALTAKSAGLRAAVVEKSSFFGGTAAVSGGMIWVPCNPLMSIAGIADSTEDALAYLRRVSAGRTYDAFLRCVVESGPAMVEFVGREAGLHFEMLEHFPDYHAEWNGACAGGRSLEPRLYDARRLGRLADALREDHRPPFTMGEYEDWRIFTRFPYQDLEERARRGLVARGRALVGPLLEACAQRGVVLVTGFATERLLSRDSGGVVGVVGSGGSIDASRGVILACGGFEWSAEMVRNYLPGPLDGSCSPPHNTGDGIRMAAKLGARLSNMNEAWWGPMVTIPGETCDGAPSSTLLRFERTGPGTIMVDHHARRFVNEAHNYNDMTKAMHAYDPTSYRHAHLPAYLIFDEEHLRRYGFLGHRSGQPVPAWLTAAPTLDELAGAVGIEATHLAGC